VQKDVIKPQIKKVDAQDVKVVKEELKQVDAQNVKVAKTDIKQLDAQKPKVSTKEQIKVDAQVQKIDTKKVDAQDVKVVKEELKQVDAQKPKVSTKEQIKQVDAQVQNPVLLFKEELQSPKIQHTTQQMVEIKKVKSDSKVIKPKTDSLLSSLISGENTSNALKQEQSLSGILSTIDTAPILKTQTQQDNSIKDLASMLSGDVVESGTKDTTSEVKADGINVLKADSFEVKLNEAKQMIRYISQDIKQAIDEYKSPFTRVKLQLNPKNLGEVDLTVVQRGKNLHVNLSSNNVAINTLSANVNELRVQLNNSGINNATLNFNNNSQNSHQGQHKPRDEYRYFENEEKNEELTDSLEIIVPHYA
jgi:hypothetical protein